MDTRTRPSAASKSKAHSRLASFGRHTFRAIVSTSEAPPRGETLPRVPVSPSDSGSEQKPSGASTRSNTSSETALTDDAGSDINAAVGVEERVVSTSDAASWLDSERAFSPQNFDEYERHLSRSPRTMHQTSSKLLRMTDDDRPFTRVCCFRCGASKHRFHA